jgi:hypothetical protein
MMKDVGCLHTRARCPLGAVTTHTVVTQTNNFFDALRQMQPERLAA